MTSRNSVLWEHYPANMPIAVVRLLEEVLECLADESTLHTHMLICQRIQITYGDPITGKVWRNLKGIHRIRGYLNVLTTTTPPTVILGKKPLATDGVAVQLANIIKIESTKNDIVVYRHPAYHEETAQPKQADQQKQAARTARRIML